MCMLASGDIEGMLMPKFVIERDVPGAGNLSYAQLREILPRVGQRSEGNGPRDSVAT